MLEISIHAPLAGRDASDAIALFADAISIHAPLAGRDTNCKRISAPHFPFQSTRPLRGATFCLERGVNVMRISIHAPLAGRD